MGLDLSWKNGSLCGPPMLCLVRNYLPFKDSSRERGADEAKSRSVLPLVPVFASIAILYLPYMADFMHQFSFRVLCGMRLNV